MFGRWREICSLSALVKSLFTTFFNSIMNEIKEVMYALQTGGISAEQLLGCAYTHTSFIFILFIICQIVYISGGRSFVVFIPRAFYTGS